MAESKDSVLGMVQGAAEETAAKSPDFVLMQEVDLDATRSYHVNQRALLDTAFSAYDSAFAVAYDSAYLLFPPWEPHGKSLSGMATYSRFPIETAVRYRLPISEDLNKFFDLDRCYSVSKIPVENGKYFCLYHVHLSAYGNDASIRSAQIATLAADMESEYAKENYVLCGGDFNHDMVLSEDAEKAEGWAKPFPREDLPQGFHVAMDLLEEERRGAMVKSTRKADTPYDPETSYLVTVDGFILSDNITLEFLEVEENGFRYSDHHPIRMIFKLKA